MLFKRIRKFSLTKPGRFFLALLVLAVFNLNSCTIYQSTETTLGEIRSMDQIVSNMDHYKFYVHDPYGTYLLQNAQFDSEGNLTGSLLMVTYEIPDSSWKNSQKRAYWQDHKYDIGIYTRESFNDLSANLEETESNLGNNVVISPQIIDRMTITSINMEGELNQAAIVLLVVLGIIVSLILLIVLVSVTATASSDGTSGSSNGSGSDSNSGGSGSSG